MSNSKSEVDIIDPGGQTIGHVSTSGATKLPSSAGVPLTVTKTASGKVTKVSGTLAGVVVELPEPPK